ncbi:MAG: hypothetical protein ACRDPY_32205 [Streptosporangiaceae bacterium]
MSGTGALLAACQSGGEVEHAPDQIGTRPPVPPVQVPAGTVAAVYSHLAAVEAVLEG